MYCISTLQALGCVLYVLCFTRHPFEDSAKLKIMNANYTIPEFDRTFQSLHHLIRKLSVFCFNNNCYGLRNYLNIFKS